MQLADETLRRIHVAAPLTDIHAHPSLKAYLWRRNLWRHYRSGSAFNPFSSRSDFSCLEKGGVGALWAAHHLVERRLFRDVPLLHLAFMFPIYWKLTTGSLMRRLEEMMDKMEREIARKPERTELALSAAEVKRICAAGKIAIVHTVEGGHVLEGKLENLDRLAQRGVAMLTLCHFYENGLASQVVGIPQDYAITKFFRLKFGAYGQPPLTEFGRAVMRRLQELRMLLDITHCTPHARAAIYAELNGRRPILASHSGVAKLNPDAYNLADDELREIARSGGGVGLIFMNYWLDRAHPKNGLPALWQTLEHIQRVTNSWNHIMIGTDFDGFTDPPDDLTDAGQMGKFTQMLLDHGLDEAAILKILGGNAQRILEQGWR